MSTSFSRFPHLLIAGALAALLAPQLASAQIATGTTGINASGQYKSEVADCKSGHTQQSTGTCMTEATHARAAKKRGKLTTATVDFKANAMARCDVLSGVDRSACQARMRGEGETSGSVAGGGVLREVETVVKPKPTR